LRADRVRGRLAAVADNEAHGVIELDAGAGEPERFDGTSKGQVH